MVGTHCNLNVFLLDTNPTDYMVQKLQREMAWFLRENGKCYHKNFRPRLGGFLRIYICKRFYCAIKILHFWLWCSYCVTFIRVRVTINSTTYKCLTIKYHINNNQAIAFLYGYRKLFDGFTTLRDWHSTINY